MKGRKPKPTALKLISGNPGHRPLNEREPQPSDLKPRRPKELSPEGRKAWKIITEELEAMGILSRAEFMLIATLAEAYAEWQRARREIDKTREVVKTSEGDIIQNPWLRVANAAVDKISRLSAQLGLDPTSRSRIKAKPKEAPTKWSKFSAS